MQDYEVLYSRYSSGGTLKTYQKVENNKDAATHADVAKNEKEQITAGTVTARRVEIRITKSVNNGGSKVNACLIRAIFHGNVDGVEYALSLIHISPLRFQYRSMEDNSISLLNVNT